MRYYLENRDWLMEHSSYEEIEAADEMVPYDLIHELLGDIKRLAVMAIAARRAASPPSEGGDACGATFGDVYSAAYHDHPAIDRYISLFGDDAHKPWEF
jgi:hypothetical protein